MDIQDETAPEETWSITEIEATARDIVDVGFWESAEEEERAIEAAIALPHLEDSAIPSVSDGAGLPIQAGVI